MPPQPPPAPPALTALSSLSALVAAYVATAIVEVGRGGAGLAAGVALRRFEALPPLYLVHALQDGAPAGPGGWLLVTFAGPVLLVLVALGLAALVGMTRSKGWLRSFALSLMLVALAWIPLMLAAGAVNRAGGGPVAQLYAALGEPRVGRWAALGLGVLALWLAAGIASARAVATGRMWMRADAITFRRRLVRVVAGYPLAVASATAALVLGWMTPVFAVLWGTLTMVFMVIRTV